MLLKPLSIVVLMASSVAAVAQVSVKSGAGGEFSFSADTLSIGGAGTSMRGILRREDVRNHLRITLGQRQKLDEMAGGPGKPLTLRVTSESHDGKPDPEALKRQIEDQVKAQVGDTESKLKEILKPDQFDRLKELATQWHGYLGLRHTANAKRYGISEATRQKIQEIAKPVIELRDKIMREGTETIRDASPDGSNVRVMSRVDPRKMGNPNTPDRQKLERLYVEAEGKAAEALTNDEAKSLKDAMGTKFPFAADNTRNWNRYFTI